MAAVGVGSSDSPSKAAIVRFQMAELKLHQTRYESCKRFDVLTYASLLQRFHIFLTAIHGNHHPRVA